jgi:hypothetical protein
MADTLVVANYLHTTRAPCKAVFARKEYRAVGLGHGAFYKGPARLDKRCPFRPEVFGFYGLLERGASDRREKLTSPACFGHNRPIAIVSPGWNIE